MLSEWFNDFFCFHHHLSFPLPEIRQIHLVLELWASLAEDSILGTLCSDPASIPDYLASPLFRFASHVPQRELLRTFYLLFLTTSEEQTTFPEGLLTELGSMREAALEELVRQADYKLFATGLRIGKYEQDSEYGLSLDRTRIGFELRVHNLEDEFPQAQALLLQALALLKNIESYDAQTDPDLTYIKLGVTGGSGYALDGLGIDMEEFVRPFAPQWFYAQNPSLSSERDRFGTWWFFLPLQRFETRFDFDAEEPLAVLPNALAKARQDYEEGHRYTY